VAESEQVSPGELRVFLSDGTLVMASPHGKPAFGTWRYQDGGLRITEEGREYPVDVLALAPDTFRIRIRGPGEPVVILFRPAPEPRRRHRSPRRLGGSPDAASRAVRSTSRRQEYQEDGKPIEAEARRRVGLVSAGYSYLERAWSRRSLG
jgi:hypothetical protein